jgi:hypothetical protein
VVEPIDIVVLSYNRLDYLIEMVEGLERDTRWPHRLTIVDNASGPATRQWLRDNERRFERVVFNAANEHLAGHARGIAATASGLFVLSDADVIPHAPTAEGCWLTRLVALAERHPDFGLIGARLDSVTRARNERLESAAVVDGEILETPTGVWLNLIRREALRVPYMSDGITCYALRRAGYRVGIAREVYATHLGDGDSQRHPDYLARKAAASGWGVTYPDYPELAEAAPAPSLRELALAAPLLNALDAAGVAIVDVVELAGAAGWPLGAVEPEIRRGAAVPAGAARAVAVAEPSAATLEAARAGAAEWLFVLGGSEPPPQSAGWRIAIELPGVTPAIEALARRGDAGHSTVEHRAQWLATFRAACFGEELRHRVYVLRRDPPLAAAEGLVPAPDEPRPRRGRRRRIGPLATKAQRLLRAEWHLLRGRRRA